MSDTEYEKFEINDYDLENEFNPFRAGRKRPTKNQQIYGIWAEDDSDDEGNQSTSKGRNRADTRKGKDYTAPIGFVAGGIQQSGKKKEEDAKKSDEGKCDAVEKMKIIDNDECFLKAFYSDCQQILMENLFFFLKRKSRWSRRQ